MKVIRVECLETSDKSNISGFMPIAISCMHSLLGTLPTMSQEKIDKIIKENHSKEVMQIAGLMNALTERTSDFYKKEMVINYCFIQKQNLKE